MEWGVSSGHSGAHHQPDQSKQPLYLAARLPPCPPRILQVGQKAKESLAVLAQGLSSWWGSLEAAATGAASGDEQHAAATLGGSG